MNHEIPPFSEEAKNFKLGKYRHYRAGEYEVVTLGRIEATLEEAVVYRALYGDNQAWVRPLKEFLEEVEVEGKSIKRFTYES